VSAPSLIELVYISAAREPLDARALADLLTQARRNNAQKGLTGILLHCEGSFLQVLEGAAETVDGLYERIREDRRHQKVVRLSRKATTERTFGEWSMGYVDAATNAGILPGFNEFFARGLSNVRLQDHDGGRVRDLLTQFGKGHWRQQVR
jgi:hypothetical protein